MTTVLVCGGRDYADRLRVFAYLDFMHARTPITKLVNGGAAGADWLAVRWAKARNVRYVTIKANWDLYGKAAGHIRNTAMLDDHTPDHVVAFPGGTGTANMVKQAMGRGVPVSVVTTP